MSGLTILELAVVLLACLPVLRLLGSSRLRGMAPAVHRGMVGIAVLCSVGILALAILRPSWLHPVALGVVLAASLGFGVGRSDFGTRRGLPPGRLSLPQSVEAIVRPAFYRRQFELRGPVFKMLQFHRPTICLLGLERSHRLLREHGRSMGPAVLPFNRQISGGFLRYMDDQTHRRYAGLFREALSPQIVQESGSLISEIARSELTSMAGARTESSAKGVPPGRFLERVVFAAFVQVLFDIRVGTTEFAEFRGQYERLLNCEISHPLSPDALEALGSLRKIVSTRAVQMRSEMTGDGAVASALESLIRSDPAQPDETSIDNMVFITRISSFNVVGLLLWCLHCLGRHPEWVERLRGEIRESGSRDTGVELSRRIMLETLRLHQSEYLYRVVKERFEYDGFTFPTGWLIRMCIGESHRNPEHFEDPGAFDPDRFLDGGFSSAEFSPFGYGPHACNGIALTEVICRAVIEELTAGFDWAVVGDGEYEREFRHWAHLRPSSGLEIRMGSIVDGTSSEVERSRRSMESVSAS